jgi:hypothetical protein
MDDLFGRAVFAVGDRTYCWEDVVLAAKMRDDWDSFERDVRRGLACVAHVEEAGEGPSEEELEAAAGDFRYGRDLVSAEEMETWLDRRGLSLEEWMGYVLRDRLRRDLAQELEEIETRYPVEEDDLTAALKAEGLCSGEFGRFAIQLAARAAGAERMRESLPEPPDDGVITEVVAADSLPRAFQSIPADQLRERLQYLARVEADFGRFRSALLTPGAVQAQVAAHRLDWIQLDCRVLSFPAEDMAREAALCVREDGQDLEEIAAETRGSLREGRYFLEDLDGSLRDALLASTRGELLGPLAVDGEFALVHVTDKVMPSESDPAALLRAEERIVDAAVARETERRVRWIDLL